MFGNSSGSGWAQADVQTTLTATRWLIFPRSLQQSSTKSNGRRTNDGGDARIEVGFLGG